MDEPEKIDSDVEARGDVTHTKFIAPKPKRERKPLPRWIPRTLLVAGVLLLAAGSFYGAWWLAGPEAGTPTEQSNTTPQVSSWDIAEAKAKVPRTEVSAALYEGNVYVVGGLNKDGQALDTVELFDPKARTWSDGPALPAAVHHTSAVAFDNGLYVVGGLTGTDFKPTSKVFIYDGDAWLEGPALPEPLGAQGATVLDDRLYVVGGNQADGASTGKMYSLGKDDSEWRTEPAMPTPRNHLTAAAVDKKLYAIAGRNDSSMTLQTVEVYDLTTRSWTEGSEIPTGRSGLTSVVLDGRILVFGGESQDKTFSDAEEFNPITQGWRRLTSMQEARHGLGSAVFNNRVFLFLGGPQPGLSVSDNVQIVTFE